MEELNQKYEDVSLEMAEFQKQFEKQRDLAVLGEAVSAIVHELRNPLGTIRTSLFLINESLQSDNAEHMKHALEIAERNIKRCDHIIDELVDYAQYKDFKFEPVDIDNWLSMVIKNQDLPKEIEVIVNLNAGIKIHIDSERLRHAVNNLINNSLYAIDQKGSGPNQLRIESHLKEQQVEVVIEDFGCGIEQGLMEKIFTPLFSTKPHGLGLGLPIVQKVVKQHGGDVKIESQPERGAKVIFYLDKEPLPITSR